MQRALARRINNPADRSIDKNDVTTSGTSTSSETNFRNFHKLGNFNFRNFHFGNDRTRR